MNRQSISLADFVGLKRGYDLPSQDRIDGDIPILGSFGITGRHAVAKHVGPGVSIGRSGASIGVATYCETPYWPLNTTLYVHDFKDACPRFVFYVLKSIDFTDFNSGSAQPSLNRNYLAAIPVVKFSRHEQELIADILGSVDDLIENNRRRLAVLEEMAQAIYREWFVHFRYPGHDDAGLTDSPLGPVPEDWQIGPLSHLAEVTRKSVIPTNSPMENFTHFSLPSYDEGKRPTTELGSAIRSGKYLLSQPCVLLSKLNPRIPRVWFVELPSGPTSIASTEFLVLTPTALSNLEHIYLTVSAPDFQVRLQGLTGGTSGSHQRAKPGDVMALPVVIPSAEVVAQLGEALGPLLKLQRTVSEENTRFASIRDLLLPKLVSGEIDVAHFDLDALIEGASP